jgi:fructose-specific PTS system IIA-like component
MPREIRFQFPLPQGLHARPASFLQAVANRFASEVCLVNERTQRSANAKSVLSMVSADVRLNDECVLKLSGADEQRAEQELKRFLREALPVCDDDLPPAPSRNGDRLLPRSLRGAGLQDYYRGTPVSAGIGWGRVVLIDGVTLSDNADQREATDPTHEKSRFENARDSLRRSITARIAGVRHGREKDVLRAHLAILDDVALSERVHLLIDREHRTASQAVRTAGDFFIATLQASESAYLRERVLDLQDVCGQLLDLLIGKNGTASHAVELREPSICVAERLTPGQFLMLDRRFLKGLVLGEAGTTSHTVILARSMNVPTLVGVHDVRTRLAAAEEVIMDANLGILIPRVTEPIRRYYQLETRKLEAMQERLATTRDCAAITSDGLDLEIGANVASAEEVPAALESGADGIGLFRTEMLFINRDAPPSEQEQFDIYRRAARAARGSPVMIRLFDVGGDKPAPYLQLPVEANPFLGFRGVRVYAEHADLLRTQLRAILRAAEWGDVRILVPMISRVEELVGIRQIVKELRDELAAQGQEVEPVPIGAMLEVPSCAFLMDELCGEADFFSIGSNDLAQYFLAADRDNSKVSEIYSWAHPAFLRLLQTIVDAAHEHGKWIGLCGEMADSDAALPLLIAIGLDEISLAAPRIAAMRRSVCNSEFARCTQLLEQAIGCATRDEVESLLEEFSPADRKLPLMSPDLILYSGAISKAEVIKEMTDALWLAGRASDPQLLEEAVWQREDAYSTGFGYGFALPHCKSDAVDVNSIVVAKLAEPVEWGSSDQQPVDVVILLVMRAPDYEQGHMRVFAQLSRLVMREEFRERVRELDSPERLLAFLKQSFGIGALEPVA